MVAPVFSHIIIQGTTNGSGALDTSSEQSVYKTLYRIDWLGDALDPGATLALTVHNPVTGEDDEILTLAAADLNDIYYPVVDVNIADGTVVDGAKTHQLIYGRPRVVIASGGDTKTAKAVLYFLEQ